MRMAGPGCGRAAPLRPLGCFRYAALLFISSSPAACAHFGLPLFDLAASKGTSCTPRCLR